MRGQWREFRDRVMAWAARHPPAAIGIASLAAVAVLAAAGTVAFAVLSGGSPARSPRPLSTAMASQQLVGLAIPGPGNGAPQRLLARSGPALAFRGAGAGGSVLPSEQWQADEMTDGSYVVVYLPDGTCLSAAHPVGSAPGGAAELSLKTCDLRLPQRWSHPYLGKDPAGRDYWQLRSDGVGMCVSAAGNQWADGTAARLSPCGRAYAWQQLVEFWSAY